MWVDEMNQLYYPITIDYQPDMEFQAYLVVQFVRANKRDPPAGLFRLSWTTYRSHDFMKTVFIPAK